MLSTLCNPRAVRLVQCVHVRQGHSPQDHLRSLAGTDHHLLLELVALCHTQLAHGSDLTLVHIWEEKALRQLLQLEQKTTTQLTKAGICLTLEMCRTKLGYEVGRIVSSIVSEDGG